MPRGNLNGGDDAWVVCRIEVPGGLPAAGSLKEFVPPAAGICKRNGLPRAIRPGAQPGRSFRTVTGGVLSRPGDDLESEIASG